MPHVSNDSLASQNLEVYFSQCELEGSDPVSPDELPSLKELSEGLKATRRSALHGKQAVATEDNPDHHPWGMRSAAKLQTRCSSLDGTDEDDTRGR